MDSALQAMQAALQLQQQMAQQQQQLIAQQQTIVAHQQQQIIQLQLQLAQSVALASLPLLAPPVDVAVSPAAAIVSTADDPPIEVSRAQLRILWAVSLLVACAI